MQNILALVPDVLALPEVLPEILVGNRLRRLEGGSHVYDVSLVCLLNELAARAHGVDGDEVVGSVAASKG